MRGIKFIVRWTDNAGKNKSKEYSEEIEARKAKQWLLDRGAADADIAIQMGGRERPVADKAPKEKVVEEQPTPWYDR